MSSRGIDRKRPWPWGDAISSGERYRRSVPVVPKKRKRKSLEVFVVPFEGGTVGRGPSGFAGEVRPVHESCRPCTSRPEPHGPSLVVVHEEECGWC